jgi:CBS domain-containing membrane protein
MATWEEVDSSVELGLIDGSLTSQDPIAAGQPPGATRLGPDTAETIMGKMLVQELMTAEVQSLRPDATLSDLLDLMYDNDFRHVPVVDEESELLGLVTHRDVVRGAVTSKDDLPQNWREEILNSRTVDNVMATEVYTISPSDTVEDAAHLMLDHKLGCLPVLEGGRLVGILTESDFVRHVADTC